MRFRQVHLDFHTSEHIDHIGRDFSKTQFQEMLRQGHVDSITVFSKCHHGWAYHPSIANEMHPHLNFDLLGAQIEAAHEIGVNTPVYLSAGLDEKEARRHPEWIIRERNDTSNWAENFRQPGYHQFCMNTPYLDILVRQIEEVVKNYDADGIFLDIVGVRECVCSACLASLEAAGQSPKDERALRALWERTYAEYTRRTNEAVHKLKPGLPVFHNGGHIERGRRDLAAMNTHLELESLPTGGWGYDHFPLSARYVQNLGMDYLGMTGKFHTSWGEFGGYKHPNALRYEAALSLANGAKCSVGDQLHPEGRMDPATYALIGAAYAEVEAKEPWCRGAKNIADIGLLSLEAARRQFEDTGARVGPTDAGAVRMLLEGHYLFDVLDLESDFSAYKVLILPDAVIVGDALKSKLDDFLASGGRILATGTAGLNKSGESFAFDFGARYDGPSAFHPEFFHPAFSVAPLLEASFVMYGQGQKITLTAGESLGYREEPYFNRTFQHFCSHQHTPGNGVNAGPGVVEGKAGVYIAWNVFEDYATKGSLILKKIVHFALDRLLGEAKSVNTSLGAQGIVTLTRQQAEDRYVLHLLYASPVKRGNGIEVIEDLPEIHNVQTDIHLGHQVTSVRLEPQGVDLDFDQTGGHVTFTVPRLECHQMVVLS